MDEFAADGSTTNDRYSRMKVSLINLLHWAMSRGKVASVGGSAGECSKGLA
jgi:hypothetical protein